MANSDSPPASRDFAAFFGRWILLALLAGHLLLRRNFARHNLGELLQLAGISPPGILSSAYITEVALLLLLPLAVLSLSKTRKRGPSPPGDAALRYGLGPAFYLAAAFVIWSAGHALVGFFRQPHDTYLIFRQSALGSYAIIFIFTHILFGNRVHFVRQAAGIALLTALACAALDSAGLLSPKPGEGGQYPDEHLFGQQTLPLGILAAGLFFVYMDSIPWRIVTLAALGFMGWRESRRELQSAVIVGMGGALVSYLLLGGALALRRQVNTLKRAILLIAFFGVLFLGYRAIFHKSDAQKREMSAMSLETYQRLFEIYESTNVPADPQIKSPWPPFETVTDPEAYKLNVVYETAQREGGVSVVNNIWRLLIWRRMIDECRREHPIAGAGVGRAWFYPAFNQTRFHHGEVREGLDPHNSFLNVVYRYGAIGAFLLFATIFAVLFYTWKALKLQPQTGDVLLEGTFLFFIYCAVFACFTVSLEGPSYALPFWMSLGLLYAHARQNLAASNEAMF